jgi:Presenilin
MLHCNNTHSGDSTSTLVGKSLVNSLVIVAALAAATCVIVLLYRFRCMKCLIGYMMLSSALLLGIMGGLLWYTVSYTIFSSILTSSTVNASLVESC